MYIYVCMYVCIVWGSFMGERNLEKIAKINKYVRSLHGDDNTSLNVASSMESPLCTCLWKI